MEYLLIEKFVSVVGSSPSAYGLPLNGEVNIAQMMTCKISVFPEKAEVEN